VPVLKIELKEVSKVYKMGDSLVHALRKVDLQVRSGEFLSVVGPSGSGKTTLLNIIGALDRPTSGRILLGGDDITSMGESGKSRIRLMEFGFIFQQFYLLPALNAFQNVHLPIRESGNFGPSGRKRARELLDIVGISAREKHLPSQMSGGEQQRVAIARALANDPSVILADEPTGELDTENSEKIMDILKRLNKDMKKTVIIVTHDPDISRRSKRTIRMKDGQIQ
jgi:putative ABC transport system ATP-binding protein